MVKLFSRSWVLVEPSNKKTMNINYMYMYHKPSSVINLGIY